MAFLKTFAEECGFECPTGRGATSREVRVFLPHTETKTKVFQEYMERYHRLAHFFAEEYGFKVTFAADLFAFRPLCDKSFLKIWRKHCSHIRIMKAGSDFCDYCTELTNFLESCKDPSIHEKIEKTLAEHKNEAREEFHNYKSLMSRAQEECHTGIIHIVFDFAEKAIVPHLLRQPGQLHFITGLRFDLFGVVISNLALTDIHCLPEGWWPGGKTANEVASMLHYSLSEAKRDISVRIPKLQLHADNCSGQNKNRYILWYMLWRVICGYEKEITLFFLIAGHTKNRCDGSFGFVKQKMRQRNVITPRDMVDVVRDSYVTNRPRLSSAVRWFYWKDYLSQYFKIPSSLKIEGFQVFLFRADDPCNTYAKPLSSSPQFQKFCAVKEMYSAEKIRSEAQLIFDDK